MRREIVPEILAGRKRACLAITEAYAGSDVASLRCTAVKSADGSHYIVNGSKKYVPRAEGCAASNQAGSTPTNRARTLRRWITNAVFADYFVAAVRTGGPGAGGISMLLIPAGEGVEVKLIKTDYSSAAGTGFVTFENVKVPVSNLMSKENKGFAQVMANFNHERW